MGSKSIITQARPTSGVSAAGLPGTLVAAIWVLLLLPTLLIAFKLSSLPGSEWVSELISLNRFALAHERAHYVLFVPLGALCIVVLRLVFGIRVLGPFRSVLLAIAFQMTGFVVGVSFLALVTGVVVAIKPIVKKFRIPYFGRVSTVLGAVSVMIIVAILIGQRYDLGALQNAAYFPIVVLTLTADGFARTLRREGMGSALWRGSMTALAAIAIAGLSSIDSLTRFLIRFPEVTLAAIGLILVISKYFSFRLLKSVNPVPVSPKNKSKPGSPSYDDGDDEELT